MHIFDRTYFFKLGFASVPSIAFFIHHSFLGWHSILNFWYLWWFRAYISLDLLALMFFYLLVLNCWFSTFKGRGCFCNDNILDYCFFCRQYMPIQRGYATPLIEMDVDREWKKGRSEWGDMLVQRICEIQRLAHQLLTSSFSWCLPHSPPPRSFSC
jgi:hypothetical protein